MDYCTIKTTKKIIPLCGLCVLSGAINYFNESYPCYLGRYNGEYDAPRQSISKVKGLKILEMEKSREKAMCCGAGGGHYWMDLKVGERVNVLRTQHAQETGASQIATACPFCMQMLEDGVNLTGLEGKLKVRDLAEVLAEAVCK
ncbi:MAG: hypothetical protein DCC75_12390 [Proteobacteria bacterium]|nr:MAG: hypothetical protein DCC75_12390 [Pseudomonadota bacterium]